MRWLRIIIVRATYKLVSCYIQVWLNTSRFGVGLFAARLATDLSNSLPWDREEPIRGILSSAVVDKPSTCIRGLMGIFTRAYGSWIVPNNNKKIDRVSRLFLYERLDNSHLYWSQPVRCQARGRFFEFSAFGQREYRRVYAYRENLVWGLYKKPTPCMPGLRGIFPSLWGLNRPT